MKKEFVTLSLSEIKPYKNNPRNNDNTVDDVAESMDECGELDPIEVDENNEILSGKRADPRIRLRCPHDQG